ncbi:hypothetical protein DEA8626_02649 [Defluviimonas aquaemixtae]|uniref:HPt domain-containing protein n=1 Tax=Albidovulum aquaemixtae TaxID=1542388 RepID=A0A2R8BJN9_9RHOB|nr:Hpt domain-containing protein [Defluviimonas aquaemixtae]SPH23585.1 hypothetical protein DEA8626_02649 [Defluviimonas aquaemixtae]
MIDWKRVEELQSEIGPEGFAEIVELFLDEVEEMVMRLKTAPRPAQYESDLHFLKGGAWNLGFAEFGALCQDGERRTVMGQGDKVDIAGIVSCYFASKTMFFEGLAGRGIQIHSAA